jgi:hypothetical protein
MFCGARQAAALQNAAMQVKFVITATILADLQPQAVSCLAALCPRTVRVKKVPIVETSKSTISAAPVERQAGLREPGN